MTHFNILLTHLPHSGMAAGCRSLGREALPTILEQLGIFKGFSLLVVGYSLGAGLAQLFTRFGQAMSIK